MAVDGWIDVATSSAFDHEVAWYRSNGSRAFTRNLPSATLSGARSVYAADLDGDVDVIAGPHTTPPHVVWFENLGGGAFAVQAVISASVDGASSVHAADLDLAGDLDALATAYSGNAVARFESAAGGAFGRVPSARQHVGDLAGALVGAVEPAAEPRLVPDAQLVHPSSAPLTNSFGVLAPARTGGRPRRSSRSPRRSLRRSWA